MTIYEIVDLSMEKISKELLLAGKVDLRSIIFLAVQMGMADAYDRGIDKGKIIQASYTEN